jgi:polysaccharide export outer membrane protein
MANARAALAVVLMWGTVTGCVSPAVPAPGRPPTEPEYRIAPPDVLSVSVRPAPEINRKLVVRPDGKISFDLVGDVEVAGKTVREVRDVIEDRLKEFVVHPDVTVILDESKSRRFYVLGEVYRPGAYTLVGDVSALRAIAGAGGVTRFANKGGIRLVRPGTPGVAYEVDFDDISRYGNAETNHPLQPGDVIYVPPNGFASVGYAIGIVLFPIQQIIGLGSGFYGVGGGGFNNDDNDDND